MCIRDRYSTGPDSRVISSYPSGVWVIFRLFLYIPISFSSLKDLGQIRAEYHDVRPTAPAETGCQGLVDVRHLAVAGFAHYLPGRLADAYQRGSPDRVRRYYASRRVDRQHTVHAEGVLCLLYTSDAADDLLCVDLGGRRIIKK